MTDFTDAPLPPPESRFDDPLRGPGWIPIHEDVTERKWAEQALVQSNAQLRALAIRLSQVEEAERRRLAMELHDRVGQNLTALNLNLNLLRGLLPAEGAAAIVLHLDDSIRLVDETMERIRDVMAELRPAVLDDYGLGAALRWYAGQLSRRTGIRTEVESNDEAMPRLPAQVETALFRIAQEALTNIGKHARASSATLRLERKEAWTRLTISDDGVGFDPSRARSGIAGGWGLHIVRERAEAVGGRLEIKSAPGKGTQISVEVA